MKPPRESDGVAFVEIEGVGYAALYNGQIGPCSMDSRGLHVNREWLLMQRMAEAVREGEKRRGGELPPITGRRSIDREGERMAVMGVCREEGPDTPRDMLPDEMPSIMAAGWAGVNITTICRLCREGAVAARRRGPYREWIVDTDSLIAWMVRKGIRRITA